MAHKGAKRVAIGGKVKTMIRTKNKEELFMIFTCKKCGRKFDPSKIKGFPIMSTSKQSKIWNDDLNGICHICNPQKAASVANKIEREKNL